MKLIVLEIAFILQTMRVAEFATTSDRAQRLETVPIFLLYKSSNCYLYSRRQCYFMPKKCSTVRCLADVAHPLWLPLCVWL
jgi:hypothetical protein